MYVKLFNRILDSSLADNRKLRHFFIDLLLCSDADGNVIMTNSAIGKRIRADYAEVEWGLSELSKPDKISLSPEHEGRRIMPLEGHGYGWKIINYEAYRDLKSAQQMREATAERVRRFRKNKRDKRKTPKAKSSNGSLPGENEHEAAFRAGASQEELDRIVDKHLPNRATEGEAEI